MHILLPWNVPLWHVLKPQERPAGRECKTFRALWNVLKRRET
jgi:hypothetical protein